MSIAAVAEGVAVAEDGGEAFLLHTPTGRYFRLNEAGLVAWNALAGGTEPLAALAIRYPSVAEAVLAADLASLLDGLAAAGLVHLPAS